MADWNFPPEEEPRGPRLTRKGKVDQRIGRPPQEGFAGRPKGAPNLATRIKPKVESVAATMSSAISTYTGGAAMSREQRLELSADVVLSLFQDTGWREEFAKACLLDPMGAAKLAIQLRPKDINLKSAVKHVHAILVPQTVTEEQWNQVHTARKQLADGDWGTELSDLTFMDATPEEEAS
jgi:hypothetical protein